MDLPVTLNKRIIDFLLSLPSIHDSESQRAFLCHAGLDSQLQAQIPVGKPPTQFVPSLISILLNYGKLNDGQYALEAILEASKSYVGQDKQTDCETLLDEFRNYKKGADTVDNIKSQEVSHKVTNKKLFGVIILGGIAVGILLMIMTNSNIFISPIQQPTIIPTIKPTIIVTPNSNNTPSFEIVNTNSSDTHANNIIISTILTAGYGPIRNGLVYPNTTLKPSFNNYTGESHYGFNFPDLSYYQDERLFCDVSKHDNTELGDSIRVDPETTETLTIHNYLNNNGRSDAVEVRVYTDVFYQNKKGEYVTRPFTIAINVPHYIKARNTSPPVIWDTATVISQNGNFLRLKFRPSKTSMWVWPISKGGYNNIPEESQTNLFRSGVLVGSKDSPLNGTFKPGGISQEDDQRVLFEYYISVERADTDLSVLFSTNNSSIGLHEIVTFTLNYKNNGRIEATGTIIEHDYDKTKLSINSNDLPSACNADGSRVVCMVAEEIENGSNNSLSYTATSIATGKAANVVKISSDMGDPNPQNNTVTEVINIVAN